MDCSAHSVGEFGKTDTTIYKEGIFVGYRYYEKFGVPVRYPFGHGLSYTTFTYENLQILLEEGTEENWKKAAVAVKIKNTGTREGKETVQICFQREDLAYWDEEKKQMTVEKGVYQLFVGASLTDIRLTGTVTV